MKATRLLALSAVLLLTAVYPSAQQQPAAPARAGAQPASGAPRAGGNREHGRYLVERVVMCFECHSTRDEKGNLIPATLFKGGPMPVRPPWMNDWALSTPRIAGLPGYTDELAIRLLTQGAIKRDGTQARPPMPRFRMTPQDAADVVAYVGAL
jgi:mono/diheme cytochrome c family protein